MAHPHPTSGPAPTVSGPTPLHRVDLPTGVATDVGAIGTGATSMTGLAVGDVTVE